MNNNLSGIPGKAALRDFNANAFNSSPIKRNESNNRFLQEPSSLDLFQLGTNIFGIPEKANDDGGTNNQSLEK